MASNFFFEETTYWSEGDEVAHFAWLERIGGVRGVRGEGRRVYLDVDQASLMAEDIRELNAVYRRYGGDLRQLDALGVSVERISE